MLTKSTHTKLIILIDPDKYNPALIDIANKSQVSYIFFGGSSLKKNNFEKILKAIKSKTTIPVIIFPGDEKQISKYADGLLMLSLLSGRNAEYLIGKHVNAATKIKASKVPVIPTAYILIDGGKASTTQKITNTAPLHNKKEIINTAIAGELLGKRLIYLEAGSGAKKTLTPSLIKEVKKQTSLPLIIGGGIDSAKKAATIIKSKPDYIVVGNALERDPQFLNELSKLLSKKQSVKKS
ncbi:MAG: geranylgeranylglyceryl/heptaprenylglyceryl phosphate synthase [Bacteroidota bacterium]